MIIKSLTRRKPAYYQLAKYILREGSKKQKVSPILHNMTSTSTKALHLAKEIEENGRYAHARKGGILMYHEMLSFSPDDRKEISEPMLRDIAERYLDLRLSDVGIGFAGIHLDKKHCHIHIMLSANKIQSPKKLRITKKEFDSIKREMSAYAKSRYPQLVHSFDPSKQRKQKIKERQKENSRNQRLKETGIANPSKKEQARATILKCLESAKTGKQFFSALEKAGYQTYKRGKHLGVIKDGMKYRLATLGVLDTCKEKLKDFEQVKSKVKELERVQSKSSTRKQKNIEKSR